MTTLQALIDETSAILTTTIPDPLNKLSATIDNDDTTVTMTEELKGLTAGRYFSLGLEDLYIWEATTDTRTLRVQRAMRGTTATSHTSGDLALVSSKFSPFQITQAINNELRSLSSQGVYAVTTVSLTYLSSRNSYDLTGATNVINVLDVTYDEPGSTQHWPQLKSWKLRRNANTTDFPSGFAITLFEGAYSGREFRVTYAHDYTTLFTALTDDHETTIGMPSTSSDILPLGAALRLSGYREMARNFFEGQGDPRRASEVPPGSQVQSMRPYLQMYTRRVKEEADSLTQSWPFRRRVPA